MENRKITLKGMICVFVVIMALWGSYCFINFAIEAAKSNYIKTSDEMIIQNDDSL